MPELLIDENQSLINTLIASGLATSGSAGYRLIEQKGVKFDGQILADGKALLPKPGVLQVGKRNFVRIKFTKSS